MNEAQAHGLLSLIRGASVAELGIVSVVVLPVLLASWLQVLDATLDASDDQRALSLVLVSVAYVLGIAALKLFQSEERRLAADRDMLVTYLRQTRTGTRKFATVRANLGPKFSNDHIKRLIKANPRVLRPARFAKGGVGLAAEETEDAQAG